MTYDIHDTIAAISTPLGKGGVAVIRISGPEAVAVAERVFRPRFKSSLTQYAPRTAIWGDVVVPEATALPEVLGTPGEVLDDVLCTVFRAPASYTGEDTVELSCHGGVLITRHVLTACLCAGARQAFPGEFTRRAYLSGRLGLETAEALGNLLDAGNDAQLRLSRAGMQGLLTDRVEEVYRTLCAVLSNMEAGMDFPEEDLAEMTREELSAALASCAMQVRTMAATYRTGRAIAEGVPTVICGRPNVGKSAFYNRLVGREAAIVTDIAGTTRDILTETVSLGQVTLRLCDTAGLRETQDPVERMGVERARKALESADLLFALFDPTCPCEAEDLAWIQQLSTLAKEKTVLWILTKADLRPAEGQDESPYGRSYGHPNGYPDGVTHVTTTTDAPVGRTSFPFPPGVVPLSVSSRTGDGFDQLTSAVETCFIDHELQIGSDAVVFSARQAASLAACSQALAQAMDALGAGLPYDLCAEEVRACLSPLAELSGREPREDVISDIFSRFCVGK